MKKSILAPILAIVVMAAILLGLNKGFAEKDAALNDQELSIMLHNLLPRSVEFVEEPYTGEDANIQTVYKAENGYVIETLVYGYADNIRMLVGVSNKGNVTGLVVRELNETPGLGGNALFDVDFLAQFLNTSGEAEVGNTVDGMTGATVTSKAVTRSVNSAVAFVTGAYVASSATSWGG